MANTALENGCKLFVGGLSHDTTDSTLLNYFESFGTVVSAVVLRDPETLSSRGFGFVAFASKREALNCLSYGNAIIDNKEVEIKMAKPRPIYVTSDLSDPKEKPIASKSERTVSSLSNSVSEITEKSHPESDFIQSKIFVGGLLYSTGADSLKSYFKKYGEISSAEIIYNKETKISRGFGFVEFRNLSSAIEVIKYQNEIERHKIDGKKCEVKRCLKKNESNPTIVLSRQTDFEPLSPKRAPVSIPLVKTATRTKAFSFAEAAKIGTQYQKPKINSHSNTEKYSPKPKPVDEFDFLAKFQDIHLTSHNSAAFEKPRGGSSIWGEVSQPTKLFSEDNILFQNKSPIAEASEDSFLQQTAFFEGIYKGDVGENRSTENSRAEPFGTTREEKLKYRDESTYNWK